VAEVVVDGVTGVLFEPGDRCARITDWVKPLVNGKRLVAASG
jgi:hypothetical protein